MTGAENRIENLYHEVYRSLGEMALFVTPYGPGALLTFSPLRLPESNQNWLTWVAGRRKEVRPQHYVKHLNNCHDRTKLINR